jgi:hypothetical protein
MLQAQMRIELSEVKPVVWRRILVPETVTLAKLNLILQAAMGWTYGHLHEYTVGRQRYGMPDDDWPDDDPPIDERRVRLKSLIEDRIRCFRYLYDFGDNREHDIRIEDLVLPKAGAPLLVCTAGENACPPQDQQPAHRGDPPAWQVAVHSMALPKPFPADRAVGHTRTSRSQLTPQDRPRRRSSAEGAPAAARSLSPDGSMGSCTAGGSSGSTRIFAGS